MDRWSSPMGVENRLWAYLCAALPGSFFWLGVGLRIRLGFWLGFLWAIWLVVGLELEHEKRTKTTARCSLHKLPLRLRTSVYTEIKKP
jgi:hypothetical protein